MGFLKESVPSRTFEDKNVNIPKTGLFMSKLTKNCCKKDNKSNKHDNLHVVLYAN